MTGPTGFAAPSSAGSAGGGAAAGVLAHLDAGSTPGAVVVIGTGWEEVARAARPAGSPEPSKLPREIAALVFGLEDPAMALPWFAHAYPRVVKGGVIAVSNANALPALHQCAGEFGARLAWTNDGWFAIKTAPGLPAARHDYVAPGLARVDLATAFPDRVPGKPEDHGWPYVRREIPHVWSCMESKPGIGFLSLDEAHVLYNSGLSFAGRPALEIGCWRGWSTAHLAASGVLLDVIDPALEDTAFKAEIAASLAVVGAAERVALHPGLSPELVVGLAEARSRAGSPPWELFFIDGDHEGEGPLRDARACAAVAPADAMMLFHDVIAPPVARALFWLEERGWNIRLFQTAQIMAAAWRGKVNPVAHAPDPAVDWPMPAALSRFDVAGEWRPMSATANATDVAALERSLARAR